MCDIFIRNVEYNISPSAGISFLKPVAGRTETVKSGGWGEGGGFREPLKLLII
jgi:hypothetical protein